MTDVDGMAVLEHIETMRYAIVLALLMGTKASANYDDHFMLKFFNSAPCERFLNLIYDDAVDDDWDVILGYTARQATAWGMILGLHAARGNLSGNHETLLKRLTADCEAAPDKTIREIYEGY